MSSLQTIAPPVKPSRFFALTFTLSWLIWIPLVLSRQGIIAGSIPAGTVTLLSFLGVLMPAVSALLLTSAGGGRKGVRALLSGLALWRVGWKWWAAAVLGQPALLSFTALVYALWRGNMPVASVSLTTSSLIVTIFFLLLATLGEEIGWRGVALPTLELRGTALRASAVLAAIYATWHTPYWLLQSTFDQYGAFYVLLNWLFAIPLTLYMTWLFNGGRFSILLPVALHLSFNIMNTAILPVTENITAYEMFIVFEWIIALLLVPVLRRQRFDSVAA
jgi:uncharacterized protein